ncbi:MAG: hypothetical protein AAF703_04635 [Cyanobacteria bacterium P01_D01_bin.105]
MPNYQSYQVNLSTLASDLQTIFSQPPASQPNAVILIEIIGNERLATNFADLLVASINDKSIQAIALVRDDLLIQFLVSSINLRCSHTEVKSFKQLQAAESWLLSLPASSKPTDL